MRQYRIFHQKARMDRPIPGADNQFRVLLQRIGYLNHRIKDEMMVLSGEAMVLKQATV